MKNVSDNFKDYYPISAEEKTRVFNDANTYFVFDTNALLDIYRVGQSLSAKIMKILKKYDNHIVIPFHVAEEYHEHMLPVIVGFCNQYNNITANLTLDALLKGAIKDFELDKFPFIRDALKRDLGDGLKKFGAEMKKEQKFLQNQISSWELQQSIASFLDGKIMEGFSKNEVEQIEKEGVDRYANHIPPGHEDKGKTTNIYGDLIIWKEILKFAGEHQDSSIVFISRDLKEDWISYIHGKKWGPRVELLKEFHEKTPKALLLYTLSDFIKYANTGSNILNEKDIQSVVDYTSMPENGKETEHQDKMHRNIVNNMLSNQDLQNLLYLSLLRRSVKDIDKSSDNPSILTDETITKNTKDEN